MGRPRVSPSGSVRARSTRNREFSRALLRLGRRLYRIQEEELARLHHPLSVMQYRILDRVDQGILALGMQAEAAARRPSTISKSVDSLVRRGLLTRTRPNADRRTVILGLTGAGSEVLIEARHRLDTLATMVVDDEDVLPDGIEGFLQEIQDRVQTHLDDRHTAAGRQ